MIPLKQWFCDTCGELIENPEDGWVEWLRDEDGKKHSFRICHHTSGSPNKQDPEGCYRYGSTPGKSDMHLDHMLGPDGMVHLLSMVDLGEFHDPGGDRPPRVKDFHSWAETFRRLFVPHYEEARQYFDEAKSDGVFAGANESWPYLGTTLRRIIDDYGDDS